MEWATRPAEVKYLIYGGDPGGTYKPVPNDVHVVFYVRGKEHVACRYRPSVGYQCDFGFDLTSGKSIGGSIC